MRIHLTSAPLYIRALIRGHTALSCDISLSRMSMCLQLCTFPALALLRACLHTCIPSLHPPTSNPLFRSERRGLPSTEFGIGRRKGVGVGVGVDKARGWYEKVRLPFISLTLLFILHPRSSMGCQHVLQFLLTLDLTRPDLTRLRRHGQQLPPLNQAYREQL